MIGGLEQLLALQQQPSPLDSLYGPVESFDATSEPGQMPPGFMGQDPGMGGVTPPDMGEMGGAPPSPFAVEPTPFNDQARMGPLRDVLKALLLERLQARRRATESYQDRIAAQQEQQF